MKLIVSTFLVYKVKKCLLKSGKVNDSTYKAQSWLVSLIASLWHNIAPYQGNNLPLPGTKRYVGSFFIKAPLFFLPFTLHQIGWNPDKHWGCERWRVALPLHHPSPPFTFGLRTKLNGKSTYSVFEKSPTDLAFPSAADFQFTDFHRFPGWRVGEGWWRVERNPSPAQVP